MELKPIVEKLLEEDPRCRNDDKWLYIQVLRKLGFKIWIDYSQIKKMPFPESVSRTRRTIQNQENKHNDFIQEEGITYEKPLEVEING